VVVVVMLMAATLQVLLVETVVQVDQIVGQALLDIWLVVAVAQLMATTHQVFPALVVLVAVVLDQKHLPDTTELPTPEAVAAVYIKQMELMAVQVS